MHMNVIELTREVLELLLFLFLFFNLQELLQ